MNVNIGNVFIHICTFEQYIHDRIRIFNNVFGKINSFFLLLKNRPLYLHTYKILARVSDSLAY